MKSRCYLFLIACLAASGCTNARADVPIYGFEIINTYPHDENAYTQGLLYFDGFLYESTGLRKHSSLRKVDLNTGKVLQKHDLPDRFFGEGIVQWNDNIIGVTWQEQTGFVFGLSDFEVKKTFSYPGEGWGLTRNETHIFMSDGTADIRILDPGSLTEIDRITVTFKDKPVRNLNELEWVNGEIFANIYQTDIIARIDPETGIVAGVIDLSSILPRASYRPNHTDVLNGIAFDPDGNRLFVTGKNWPKLFEIKLIEQAPNQ